MPAASVIVVSWNGTDLLEACLQAATGQDLGGDEYEVLVVDNGSTDGSPDLVRSRFPQVRLIEAGQNLGYAGGGNRGWCAASGRVLALLNQDAVPDHRWLRALMAGLEDPAVGVVGSKILEQDGLTLQHAGAHFDWPLVQGLHYGRGERDLGQYDEPRNVEYVSGAALAVRRDLLDRIGCLDEGFFPGYFEDADLCLRARRTGLHVRYVPDAIVIHQESASFGRLPISRWHATYRNRLRFVLKNWPVDQVVGEFIAAEMARLPGLNEEQLRALTQACTRAQILWPSLAASLPARPDEAAALRVIAALRSLHEACAHQQSCLLRLGSERTQ